jgi:hypothetical protein
VRTHGTPISQGELMRGMMDRQQARHFFSTAIKRTDPF